MMRALRERVVVQPNGVIEVRSPELPPPGTPAEVLILFDVPSHEEEPPPLTSLIGSAPGLFDSAREADAYLDQERNSWGS